MKSKKYKVKTLRLLEEAVDLAEAEAEKDNRSFSNMVSTLILRVLKK